VLLDAWWDQAWAETFDTLLDLPGMWEGWGMNDMSHFMIVRHPKGDNNGLFMDYSVRIVPVKECWSLRWHKEFSTESKNLPTELDDPTHWINNPGKYD
jgi:hypothetical protein